MNKNGYGEVLVKSAVHCKTRKTHPMANNHADFDLSQMVFFGPHIIFIHPSSIITPRGPIDTVLEFTVHTHATLLLLHRSIA